MPHIIEVENLSKQFDHFTAVLCAVTLFFLAVGSYFFSKIQI